MLKNNMDCKLEKVRLIVSRCTSCDTTSINVRGPGSEGIQTFLVKICYNTFTFVKKVIPKHQEKEVNNSHATNLIKL